jgi:hypothetical protein
MTADELHERFLAELDRRGADDNYIDGVEERELLQIAVQHGFAAEAGRKYLFDAARGRGYVVEAAVLRAVADELRQSAPLNRGGYERCVATAKAAVAGTTRTDRDVRRLVVAAVDDTATPVRRGWFGDWWRRERRAIGLGH